MNASNLNKHLCEIGRYGTFGYIFFSVVPYAVAGKHICSALMLIALVGLLLRKQVKGVEISWLTVSLLLVIGLAFVSAVLSPYAAESLNQLRKDGLPFLIGFLLLNNTPLPGRNRVIVGAMLSLMLGFAVKEILALWAGATNGFQFSIYEIPDMVFPKYLDFFSADTPYYLPFLLGPLCFWPMVLWQRSILFLFTALAVVVVVFSGVRTSFIFVALSLLFVLFYRFWDAKKTLLSVLGLLIITGYLLKDHITNPSVLRYITITSAQTYQFGHDGSVSERYAIAKGVWEVSKDRLLLGYGPGWKKLPTIAEANGHMDRWRASDKPIDKVALNYFSHGEGRVNPHNFYMTLLFEVGLLGLVAYLSLMAATGVGILKMLMNHPLPLFKGFAVAGLLYLTVYFGGSFAGGVWLPVTMLVTVVGLAGYQQRQS